MKILRRHIAQLFPLLIRSVGLALLLLSMCLNGYAQKKSTGEYDVKAVFLYNFTQFIDWPATAFKNPDDPFIIGIIGDDPFGPFLDEAVEGEKIGTHPIQVKRFKDLRSIVNCHILYINSDDRDWMRSVLASLSERTILTVSDDPSFTKLGGIIRFYKEDNKIRFQINTSRSKDAHLTISSKLLSVARVN